MHGLAACVLTAWLALAPQNEPQERKSTIGLDFPIPKMTEPRKDVEPFQYKDVGGLIPNYTPGEKWGAQGKPLSEMQLPLEPAESMKHFIVPEGFSVHLFASEPDIAKPLCMAWDERGRLWISESTDYPNNLQRQGQGHDRIKVCEDTDGDGQADKFTVFAEFLSIPTSIAFWDGGVIVHAAPDTFYLKDTDGDGKADERKVILNGWGIGDTHAGPSNLAYGPDNWFYGMVGYSGFRGNVGGERVSFGSGFYRFRPDGSKLEFLRSTNNNTWGIGFSEEGLLFGSTANGNPSEYMAVPNRYYEQVRGWSASVLNGIADSYKFKAVTDRVRQVDWHGGYTAAAGHALYTARSYPREYWNRTSFVTDGTGHIAGTFVIDHAGSGYRSSYKFNLLASDDEWSSPIVAEVGPDGHVWVIDWYNFIVQHNPTPAGFETGEGAAYVTPLRDKTHGRIYRVVYDGAPAEPVKSLAGADAKQIVQTLAHPNMLWRKHAQRLLVERGKPDVAEGLIALVKDTKVDPAGLNGGAVHALWTLHGLGLLKAEGAHPAALEAAKAALRHPSAGVRINAVKVLPPTSDTVSAILAAGSTNDDDARVRLAATLALADLPEEQPEAGKAVAALATDATTETDRWLPDAVTSAAAAHPFSFLAAWATQPEGAAAGRRTAGIVPRVAEHVARGNPTAEQLDQLIATLANADSARAEAVLGGLAAGWPADHKIAISDASDATLAKLLDRLSPTGKAQVARLGTGIGSKTLAARAEEIGQALVQLIGDPEVEDGKRVEAAQQLVAFQPNSPEAAQTILDTITPQTDPELAAGLIAALGDSQAEEVGPALIERLPSMTPATKAAALRLLVGRPAATLALLDAAEKGAVALRDLTLDQQQALAAHPNRGIARRAKDLLAKGGGLPNPDREKVVLAFAPLAHEKGDINHGKEVFANACAKCHKYKGEGATIGPDLTGMAVHPKEELLMQILDPSRNVEGTYRTYTVATSDGRVLTGLLASETKTSVELVDTDAKTQVLQRADIEELRVSDKSLMPEGFESQLSKKDITDLLEFLAQKGKYVPLDLAKAASVVSTKGMFNSESSEVERLVFPDWAPKTFQGVPFLLVDPQGDRVPNAVMLRGRNGRIPPRMPTSVALDCNLPAKALHFLGGVSGWGAQGANPDGQVAMIVRLVYADGTADDFPLRDGAYFADYIGPFDVPDSQLAFRLRGQQIRYFKLEPKRTEPIVRVELVKGDAEQSAPVVMAITAEMPE